MLVLEIMGALVVLAALGFGLLGWLFRPLVRKVRDQLRLENQIEANRRQFEQERAQLKSAALEELQEWMKQRAGEATGVTSTASLARLKSPVLQSILERYPLDDRVLELARVYQQATGKELLPEALRKAHEANVAGETTAEASPAATGKLSNEEARLLEEARREVELWVGGTGQTGPDTETKR